MGCSSSTPSSMVNGSKRNRKLFVAENKRSFWKAKSTRNFNPEQYGGYDVPNREAYQYPENENYGETPYRQVSYNVQRDENVNADDAEDVAAFLTTCTVATYGETSLTHIIEPMLDERDKNITYCGPPSRRNSLNDGYIDEQYGGLQSRHNSATSGGSPLRQSSLNHGYIGEQYGELQSQLNSATYSRPPSRRSSLNDGFIGEQYGGSQSQLNSVNGNYSGDARPTRCHSVNDDYIRVQYSQHSLTQYDAYQLRYNSLNNVSDRANWGYLRSSSSDYDNDDVIFTNNNSFVGNAQPSSQGFNSRSSLASDVYGEVRRGGVKRNSFDNDDCDTGPWASTSNYGYLSRLQGGSRHDLDRDVDTYAGPCIKHKPCNVQESNYSLMEDNCERNDSEQSDSQLSFYNHKPTGNETNFVGDNVEVESFSGENEPFDILDVLSFPSEWSCTVDKTGFVSIFLSSPEGESVQKFFFRSSNAKEFQLHVTDITRIENPFLHSLYLLKKEEMACRNGHVDELFLYHGTKKEHVSKICEDNLNWRLFSENHRFGQGVSFSPRATYSSHYSDKTILKIMLLCKVLVSNATIGTADMIVPPDVDGVTYDTSIKDDTRVIVKYSDNEFYPLYKIMYTKRML